MIDIKNAIKILKQGGIVIYPTDTAFGIGCRMDDAKAVKRLFQIRKRPATQATPVLVDSIEMAEKYFVSPISDNVRRLMEDSWPGALTVIYNCRLKLVPSLVRGGGKTVGLRMPNHEVSLTLIKNLGVPILGPSANFHGDRTPFKFEDIDPELIKLADYTIPGECNSGTASTVIDCSANPWIIKRQGAVHLK